MSLNFDFFTGEFFTLKFQTENKQTQLLIYMKIDLFENDTMMSKHVTII